MHRSWEWLRVRINGLLTAPSTIGPEGMLLPSTRIGWELNPPEGYERSA